MSDYCYEIMAIEGLLDGLFQLGGATHRLVEMEAWMGRWLVVVALE